MSCGNPEQSDAQELMPKKLKYDRGRTCAKCKEKEGKIVIRHTVFCKECFNSFVTLKFRRALDPSINTSPSDKTSSSKSKGKGKSQSKILKAAGNLCLAFSGGTGSAALLHMIHQAFFANDEVEEKRKTRGKDYPTMERVWEKVWVVYIDLSAVFEEYEDQYKEVEKVLEPYKDFELVKIGIERAFDEEWWEERGMGSSAAISVDLSNEVLPSTSSSSPPSTPQTPTSTLQTFLQALPTSSARSSLLTHLTRLLLSRFAASKECSHLLLGTTITSLSVGLISAVVEGGGAHIQEEIEEVVRVGPSGGGKELKIVRPLRDVSLKEAALYLWWNDLRVVPSLEREGSSTSASGQVNGQNQNQSKGIRDLIKEFILGLEKNYPSTVSAIVRTSGKVQTKGSSSSTDGGLSENGREMCILCNRPVQASIKEWKESIAIRDLKTLTLEDTGRTDAVDDPTADKVDAEETHVGEGDPTSIIPHLCYVCHTNLTSQGTRVKPREVESKVQLPVWSSLILRERVGGNRIPGLEEELVDGEKMEKAQMTKMTRKEMKEVVDEFLLEDGEEDEGGGEDK